MPWVQVHEAHEEVQSDGSRRGNDEVGKDVVAYGFLSLGIAELYDDYVEGCKCCVGHYDSVHDHAPEEHLLRSLRSIAHRQDKLHAYK